MKTRKSLATLESCAFHTSSNNKSPKSPLTGRFRGVFKSPITGRFRGVFRGVFFLFLFILLFPLTAGAETVTLTSETGLVTLNDGDVVTGTGGVETRIQVAAGATVTLSGVDIYTILNVYENRYEWPTISCLGDAVIILDEGTNNRIKSNHYTCPGIHVAQNHTLTIRGSGSLEAYSNGQAPGIGAGWQMPCGNIRIEGGNITAYGGGPVEFEGGVSWWRSGSSAIGAGNGGDCGDITITGGIITAHGDSKAAPIGGGYDGNCGDITITGTFVRVTAKKLVSHDWKEYSIYTIGPGDESSTCGTITIGGVVTEPITDPVYTYSAGYYDITYHLGGGTNANSNPATYTIESETFTLAEPTRLGYDFVGWTYEGQSTPVKNVTIVRGSTGNKTYLANWKLLPVVTLTEDAGYFELQNGQTLTGTGGPDTHITIADGATVTLSCANITAIADNAKHQWAGLSCEGDATIILADATTNNIRGGYNINPGIYVPSGKTLTIRGGGTLNVSSSKAAGIGTHDNMGACGNIVIEGGIINAAGGSEAAGIGSAARCVCGNITITTGVISVTASGGHEAASIGAGRWGSCGTVTIGGVVTGSIWGNFTYRPVDNPPCTVTFDANDGTGTMPAQTVLKNISFGLHDCTFTREDYVFTGWNTKADGSGTAYANGQTITATCDVTLYAQWDHRDTYNVTFIANGGTGTMAGQVFYKYEDQKLSACTLTAPTGYAFVGWNTKADGSGTAYTDKQNITITNDMTLYAQWRKIFTITFDANGGTGSMDSQTFIEGVPQSPSPCTFTAPSGDVFVCWNTKADGSGIAYAAGLDITITDDMTLYAQWREACIVTFDANGGTGTMADQILDENPPQTLNANTFSRDGHFFIAWNTTADGSGTAYPDKASITITADMTLYAQWAVQSGTTINQVAFGQSSVTLSNGDMLNTGRKAAHIEIDDGATVFFNNVNFDLRTNGIPAVSCKGNATIILIGDNTVGGNSTGIYIPEGKTLTIRGTGSLTAKGNGSSTGIGGYENSPSCGSIIITSEVDFVTAEGSGTFYCIGPWMQGLSESQPSCGTVTIGGVDTGPIRQQYFTYKPTCIISFDANGGAGTMAGQSFRSGVAQSLNACTITRDGYKFVGWNTAADGTGTAYTDEQDISVTSDMTLYAQWAKGLTVTFNANGDAGTMESQVLYQGISQNLNACTFTAPFGNYFIGWNTRADGSGTAYTDEQAITLNDNTTLYAQWAMPVWVDNSPVTSANHLDILGDGTVSFDPMTNTLTLDHPSQDVAIRSEGIDLTVKGVYQMSDAAGDVALDVAGGSLTLEGDFTLRGAVNGVQVGGDMNVKGQLRAYGTSGSGIHYTGTGNAWLTLVPGFIGTTRVEMQGGDAALSYTESNLFRITTNGYVLSEPADGIVSSSDDYFQILTGGVRATRAVVTLAGTANGEGTELSPFQINSSDDWTKACADVANGCETEGLYFEIGANITASAMMGRADNPFAGVIDGQRDFFKVTAAIDQDVPNAALFRAVSGATIKNFCVEGTINGGAASGGIVGQAVGGTTTMENSVFNGTVSATTGTPAGNFVVGDVASGASVTYTNCLDATNHLWPATGTTAYSVTGVDATLTLTGSTGIAWNNAIYAPEGATVEFTMSTISSGAYVATSGTLAKSGNTYSLVMPTENVAIVPNDAKKYAITKNNPTDGSVDINKTEAPAGTPVYVTATPDAYYLLGTITVKEASDNELPMTMYEDGFGFFTMPSGPVTVTVTFNKKYSFDEATGELRLLRGEFNTLSGGSFGSDVTDHKTEVLKVTADEGVRFTQTCTGLFQNFTNCTEIDLSNVNTSAMTHTTSMFAGCTNLQLLNMTGWNMQQVEYMVGMFENCSSLRELDLSNFNITADMREMFAGAGMLYMLTLPAGMGVTASMRLGRGYYSNDYYGEYNNRGWQLLGDKTIVSGSDQYDGWTCATLSALPTTATYVWKKMPDDFVLELPDGEDNSAVVEDWDGVTTNVQLTGRKLWKDGDWNTICVPFDFTNYTGYEGNIFYSAYEYLELDTQHKYNAEGDYFYGGDEQNESDFTLQTGFDETSGTLTLYFDYAPSYSPNTPYIIRWEEDTDNPYIESPTFTNVTITNTMNPAISADGTVAFTGTYDPITFSTADRSILFLGTENTLFYPEAGASINAFRSYFQLNGITAGDLPANSVKMFFGNDGTTDSLTPNPSPVREGSAGAWFDLQGRQIVNSKLLNRKISRGIYIHNGRKVVIK